LVDLRHPDPYPEDNETVVAGSVTDPAVMARAVEGADLIVHLGGIHREMDWDTVMTTNVTGTRVVLDAARDANVTRILLASSSHAVGYWPTAAAQTGRPLSPRPDTYYGLSKVAVEGLGSLYADRFGMKVVSARIGTCKPVPDTVRCLSTWLSPDDLVRLVVATASDVGAPGHHTVWAISRNTRRWADLDSGRTIGYEPVDDAELWAEHVGPQDDRHLERVGGPWATPEHELGRDVFQSIRSNLGPYSASVGPM